MYANYHTHTIRCGHATETPEEYIKFAIESGIKIMGFSDHAPFVFPDGYESPHRVKVKDAEIYISELKNLREKYKDKIKIHIGFEMEYYPLYFDGMLAYLKRLGAEYLILGQHYIQNEHPDGVHVLVGEHNNEQLKEYTDTVIKAIKSKEFLYIAHPDMFNYTQGDDDFYKSEATRLCMVAKEFDMPLEINLLGIYDNRCYPNEKFLEVVSKTGCKVIFGFDAHSKERAYDESSLEKAEKLVEKYKLNLVDELAFPKL